MLALCIVALLAGGAAVGVLLLREAVRHGLLGRPAALLLGTAAVGLIAVSLFVGTGVGAHTSKCPECGGYASSSAGACPACGRFQRGHFLFRGALLAVFAIGLGAALFLGADLLTGLGNVIHHAAEHDARLEHRLQQGNEDERVPRAEDDGEEAPAPPPAGDADAEVGTATADSG